MAAQRKILRDLLVPVRLALGLWTTGEVLLDELRGISVVVGNQYFTSGLKVVKLKPIDFKPPS